jgi:hypothetical protein
MADGHRWLTDHKRLRPRRVERLTLLPDPAPEFLHRCLDPRLLRLEFFRIDGIIGSCQILQIAPNRRLLGFDLGRHLVPLLPFPRTARRRKPAAVQRNETPPDQATIKREAHERPARRRDRSTIVLPEVRNGFEVRAQPPQQPGQLQIAPALTLQGPARAHPVHVVVDVEPEQIAGMVTRPPDPRSPRPHEPRCRQIEPGHERIDHPHQGIARHQIIEPLGKQHRLLPILARDETSHPRLRCRHLKT